MPKADENGLPCILAHEVIQKEQQYLCICNFLTKLQVAKLKKNNTTPKNRQAPGVIRRSRILTKFSYMHNEYLLRSTNNYLSTFPSILLTNDVHDLKKKLVVRNGTSTLLINSMESSQKRSR